MASPAAIFALEEADKEPIFVVCCDDLKDEIFQKASSLMQDMLRLSSSSGELAPVHYDSGSLSEPQKTEDLEHLVQLLRRREIFDEYGYFRVAHADESAGDAGNLFGIGLGSNSKKLERASRLALAVAVAARRDDYDAWLSEHSLTVLEDPAAAAFDQRRPPRSGSGTTSRQRPARDRQQSHPQGARRAQPAGRSRSRQREGQPLRGHGHVEYASQRCNVRARNSREAEQSHPSRLAPPWVRNPRRSPRSLLADDDEDEDEREMLEMGHVKVEEGACHDEASEDDEHPDRAEEDFTRDAKRELDDDISQEGSFDEEGDGVDPLTVRPPHPWVLIYDYDACQHYYWHPESHQASWNPPPGSCPASLQSMPQSGAGGNREGAAASMRGGAAAPQGNSMRKRSRR